MALKHSHQSPNTVAKFRRRHFQQDENGSLYVVRIGLKLKAHVMLFTIVHFDWFLILICLVSPTVWQLKED